MVLVVVVIVLASTIFYSQFSLNHDTSWYLVSTRMFMDGATLYDDIVEINPPLAFYLTIPPLLLSDFTGLRPTTAFFLHVSLMSGLSVLWAYSLIRRSAVETTARMLLAGGAIVGCFLIAMPDFGQREHLLLIFAMPYFVYLILRERLMKVSSFELACIGLAAFFGLGLKPYFLLIPAGIVIARFCRNRELGEFVNLANVALGLAMVGYVVFIATVHPLYLERIVPIASAIYSAYGQEPSGVLLRPEAFALLAVLALAVLCRTRLDLPAWAILGGLAGAAASFLVQFKGWNYQVIPLSFFIFFASAWIAYRGWARVRRFVALGILSLTAIYLSLGYQLMRGPYRSLTTDAFGRFVEGQGVPVLVLSSNVSASFPFVNDVEARWTSRYPAQWLLPGAVSLIDRTDCGREADACARYREILSQARSAIVEDVTRNRPKLVFVDDRSKKPYFGDSRFDYLPFLLEDPRFAELWHKFRRLDRVGEYEVWTRADKSVVAGR